MKKRVHLKKKIPKSQRIMDAEQMEKFALALSRELAPKLKTLARAAHV